jgi:hypothetical protein
MDNFDLKNYLNDNILLENEENMGIMTLKGIPVKLTFKEYFLEIEEKFSPKTKRGLQSQLNKLNSSRTWNFHPVIVVSPDSLINKLGIKPSEESVEKKDPNYVRVGKWYDQKYTSASANNLQALNISPSDFKIKSINMSYNIVDDIED